MNQLEIPYITLLDYDRERGGGDWSRIKYVLKQLIEIGHPKDELLSFKDRILSDEELESFHLFESDKNDDKIERQWIDHLKEYNVFFHTILI